MFHVLCVYVDIEFCTYTRYCSIPGFIQMILTVNGFIFFFLKVVEQGMFVKHCKVEVYLTELKLCEDSNMDNVITRRFSKADTIGRRESLHLYSRGVSHFMF